MEAIKLAAAEGLSIVNTSTRLMRFTLVGVWVLSAVSSVLAGLTFSDPWVWGTLAAGLAGALLVTRRPSRYARREAWLTVLSTTVASLVIFSYSAPSGELWMYFFASYLAAALVLRGDLRRGLIAGTLVCVVGAFWVTTTDPRVLSYMAVLLLPLVSIGVFSLVHRSLVFYMQKELLEQAETERSRAEEAAAVAAAARSKRDVAEVRRHSAPLLHRVSAGDPIDDSLRAELVLVEATIREAIRSPLLQHPELDAAVLDLRRRGGSVVRLGEAAEAAEAAEAEAEAAGAQRSAAIGDDLARALAAQLTSLARGDSVTLRMIPGESAGSVSLHVRRNEDVIRLVFARDGSIRSRH